MRNLCITLKIDAELTAVQSERCGGTRRWIRLGPTQEGYHQSVVNQVNAEEFMSPHNGSLARYKCRLHNALDEDNHVDDKNNK